MVFIDEIPSPQPPHYFVLIADDLEELHEAALQIGLKNNDFKASPPNITPCYLLTKKQKDVAVANGVADTTKSIANFVLMEDCRKWWRMKTAKRIRDKRV